MTNANKYLIAVGEEVALLRKERGWSQHDLAYQSKVNRSVIAHLELGTHEPKWAKIQALAKALGVDPERWGRMLAGKTVGVSSEAIDLAALLDTVSPEIRQAVRDWALLPDDRREAFGAAVRSLLSVLRAK